MKLCSGKMINVQQLPLPLNEVLEKELTKFKLLFSPYKEHLRDLVNIIINVKSINTRFAIRDIIDSMIHQDNSDQMANIGRLSRLVLGVDQVYKQNKIPAIYRDILQLKIKDYATNNMLVSINQKVLNS